MINPVSNAAIATLHGKLSRRFFKPWKAIAHTMGRNDMFRTPWERSCLIVAVDFAANICTTNNLNSDKILLKLNDNQRSDGCIIKAVGQPQIPIEIQLRSRLFNRLPVAACLFTIAHEFGHILNGDIDDAECLKAMAESKHDPIQDTDLQLRNRAHRNHRVELAADVKAAQLFPTLLDGIAAGKASFKQMIADGIFSARYISVIVRQPIEIGSADYRYHTHPSPQLRIRMLQRLVR